MDRKTFFEKAITYAIGKGLDLVEDNPVIRKLEEFAEDPAPQKTRQRPPGAARETEFSSLCTGCDKCMAACPANIIMIEDLNSRLPIIFPEEGPCIHCDGYPCIVVCPTNALNTSNGHTLRLL